MKFAEANSEVCSKNPQIENQRYIYTFHPINPKPISSAFGLFLELALLKASSHNITKGSSGSSIGHFRSFYEILGFLGQKPNFRFF